MTKTGSTRRARIIKTLPAALAAPDDIGLPAIIRPSSRSAALAVHRLQQQGIIGDRRARHRRPPTNEVPIARVRPWKEYELGSSAGKADNCVIVCSIENIDPMGRTPAI